MSDNNQNLVFDTDTIAFLEGVGDKNLKHNVDLGILSAAKNFNVDLDSLENLNETPKLKTIKQTLKSDKQEMTDFVVQDFIEDADVHLKDIINKVFKNSERSFVIVRDDKIEYANKTFLKILGVAGEDDV